MQIKQYLYQSPSPSAIQIGRLDPSSQKSNLDDFSQNKPVTLKEATQEPVVQSSQSIKPTVTKVKLDIYA